MGGGSPLLEEAHCCYVDDATRSAVIQCSVLINP